MPIFQKFSSSVDTDIPEISSNVNTDIPGIQLQHGRRYSRIRFRREYRYFRNLALTWTPIFQISTEKTKIRLSELLKIGKPKFVGLKM
ncbi:uncharacterized protein OCT59_016530 [Rhizophagus irregularis]|uniref:Uncharacterized protein n=1 Tax=Rhizophagus irregularis TaxID=588596 RepID=A0A915ZK94_9GLOM|nr:hypothetical protein OCT59_016530 [Rhizophagus irregularis]GET53047.1 hypothetical protein RIR_jg10346.t1 [Rhizophagus irregularis DAOM 181602=DAOM 197198]CAB4476339.1 unnamed protein product [Rhizophagus irregularis]CAB5380657.1 unnamed protein product [Rhizophagus irregularis]